MRGGLRRANIFTRRSRCIASLIFSEAGVCARVCGVAGHSFSPGRHGGGEGDWGRVEGGGGRADGREWAHTLATTVSATAHVQPYIIPELSLGFMCHCLSATCEEKDDSGSRPS
jgi:hypothetical protein